MCTGGRLILMAPKLRGRSGMHTLRNSAYEIAARVRWPGAGSIIHGHMVLAAGGRSGPLMAVGGPPYIGPAPCSMLRGPTLAPEHWAVSVLLLPTEGGADTGHRCAANSIIP